MKIFTTKNLLLILVLIFIFFIIMTLLKSMNIYEGFGSNSKINSIGSSSNQTSNPNNAEIPTSTKKTTAPSING